MSGNRMSLCLDHSGGGFMGLKRPIPHGSTVGLIYGLCFNRRQSFCIHLPHKGGCIGSNPERHRRA